MKKVLVIGSNSFSGSDFIDLLLEKSIDDLDFSVLKDGCPATMRSKAPPDRASTAAGSPVSMRQEADGWIFEDL